jgi:DNA-binding NtrC family response regulator
VVAYCAAANEETLAKELFGWEGSTSGDWHRGLIDSAQGGTLLLRGASELPVGLVPRIADVITSGEFVRTGGAGKIKANVRWIVSTEESDESSVSWVAPDLLRIAVPALRQRREDIQILVERMIERFGENRVRRVSDEALRLLKRYAFPGNVRELEGLIERACMLADGETLLPGHFQDLEHSVH